ncbi:unnamed protein product [Paramecium primaurelia]|uniref:Transmembrane protein n=1 Tax=Paramecium primaurelia TaxID=5886 RepID=A0A8S1N7I4_PARPR|nr:unnamed protein product [Paramecium primaurelia]
MLQTFKTCSSQGKEQYLTCYNDIILSSNNSCDSQKDQTVQSSFKFQMDVKINVIITKIIMKILYLLKMYVIIIISIIFIQYQLEDKCLKCTSTQSYLICQPKNIILGNLWIYVQNTQKYMEIITKAQLILYQKITIQGLTISKRVQDLSITKSSTDTIFQFISSYNTFNFQKKDGIYYSYFSNKRIFGGPLVQVNAEVKFTKKIGHKSNLSQYFLKSFMGYLIKQRYTYIQIE